MYKIYINDIPLILMETAAVQKLLYSNDNILIVRYSGKSKTLLHYINLLEESNRFQSVILYSNNYERLINDFKSLYKTIEAAGGLVKNETGKILMIFRRNFWDLPKGKLEEGESKEAAAIREVQEETGLKKLTLSGYITTTYHTYKSKKGKRILKKTYWYQMQTSETVVSPQIEEDIEQVVWVTMPEFLNQNQLSIYKNIKEVLEMIVN